MRTAATRRRRMLVSAAAGATIAGVMSLSAAQAANASTITAPPAHSSPAAHTTAIPDGTGRYKWIFYASYRDQGECKYQGWVNVTYGSAIGSACLNTINGWELWLKVYVGP